jgi:hypothetical protein
VWGSGGKLHAFLTPTLYGSAINNIKGNEVCKTGKNAFGKHVDSIAVSVSTLVLVLLNILKLIYKT